MQVGCYLLLLCVLMQRYIVLFQDLMQKQKKKLIGSTRIFYYLRIYATQLNAMNSRKQHTSIKNIEHFKETLKNCLIILNQYKIILNSCPDEGSFDSSSVPLHVQKPSPVDRIQHRHDSVWTTSSIRNSLAATGVLLQILEKDIKEIPRKECELINYATGLSDFETKYKPNIEKLLGELNNLHALFGNVALRDSLGWLIGEVGRIGDIYRENSNVEMEHQGDRDGLTHDLINKLLLVIQKVSLLCIVCAVVN